MRSLHRVFPPKLSRRGYVIVGAGAAASLVILFSLVKYSESPSFCNSCHIMEPYYEAWEHSKHNRVACVKCHYPPGEPKLLLWKKFQALSQVAKYVTRTYSSKPFAEIEDASCLRYGCHSTRLLEGRVESAKGIKFDHRPHLKEKRRGRQLRCVSCHSQMVVGKHIEVTYDTCYLCHFRGVVDGREAVPIGGCLGCHELPEETFRIGNMKYNHRDFVTRRGVPCQDCHMDVLTGDGRAPKERCFTCHNQPDKLKRFGEIPFIHENHVTKHNVACFHCHEEMSHGLDVGKKEVPGFDDPLGAKERKAHSPALMFDCSFCHERTHGGQLEMYTGKVSELGLSDMPSPMYLAQVDCVGCHYTKKEGLGGHNGRTFTASHDACMKCHGPEFKGIWEETRKELNECLGLTKGKIVSAEAALGTAQLGQIAKKKLARKLEKVKRWQTFVENSEGTHNIYLASTILRRENDLLDEIGGEMKAELPDLSDDPLISGGYCSTMCHATIGVKVPAESVATSGKKMPHAAHAAMLKCVDCHEVGTHKVMPLKKGVRESVCVGCHPG